MLYTHAIAGSKEAARFLTPHDLSKAPKLAASVMKTKLQTYLHFNQTYPGFGGFLPWITTNEHDLSPTWDWNNRVPALDNGLAKALVSLAYRESTQTHILTIYPPAKQ